MDYFDYSDTDEIEDFLDELGQKEHSRLQRSLDRIDRKLEDRSSIHSSAVEELESKIDWYVSRLRESYSLNKQSRIKELKQSLKEFYKELRRERRKHWRDRQVLEEERRKLLKELEEIEDGDLSDLL